MPKTTYDLGLKTSVQTFDAFVRCTLMGNQPWSQFQNGIRERPIELLCTLNLIFEGKQFDLIAKNNCLDVINWANHLRVIKVIKFTEATFQ